MMVAVRDRIVAGGANVMMLGVLVLFAAPDAVFVSEAWSGALIALSACAYLLDRRIIAGVCALAALFIRELAAPFCVLAAILALTERRWRELGLWIAGAVAYGLYFAFHVRQVVAHRLPADFSHNQSWLSFPGVPFLQATLLKLGWFALLPTIFSTVALVLLTAALLSSQTPRPLRLGSALYVALFLVAGLPFNDYWGFEAAPIWAITCGYGLAAILADVNAVRTGLIAKGSGVDSRSESG